MANIHKCIRNAFEGNFEICSFFLRIFIVPEWKREISFIHFIYECTHVHIMNALRTYSERHYINHNPEAIINDTSTLNRWKMKGEKESPIACCCCCCCCQPACCLMPNLKCVTCYVFELCIYVELNSLLALRPMYFFFQPKNGMWGTHMENKQTK